MVMIPGIYVEIKGDSTQLKKDITQARQIVTESAKGMSDSLNNALSGAQAKKGINTLISDLGTLSRSSVLTGNAFKGLGVNLGDLQKVTGTTVGQFQKLQEQILKTQTAAQQEKALRGIATAAGLTAKEITALGKQFGLTKTQIDSVVGQTTKATGGFTALASSAKLAFAALGVGGAVAAGRGLITIADQYSLIDSKLKLVSKSTEEFGATYKELFNISQRTGSSFTTNASAFSSLSLNLRDMNVSTSDTLKMFEMLNKSLVVNGSSTQEAASFMLQFKQAMGSGKLAGDELKAMLEANSYFGTLLAKSLGVTTGALKTLGAEGKLTTDVLIKAFPAMSEQIDKDFGQITKTIARAMVELKNAFEDVVADSNRATGATGSVANSISDLAKTVTENKEAISTLFQGLIAGAGFAIGLISDVTRSIQGLAIVAASPSKSLGDWITSNAEDMKKWQEEIANGTAFVKDRLFELAERRRDLAIVAGDAFNSDKVVSAAEKEIAAIDRETKYLQSQILAFEGLANAKKVAQDSFIVANDSGPGRSMASLSTVKDPWQVQREWSIANSKELYEIESKNYDAQKKRQEQAAKERESIEQKITASHAEATKSRYEYSIWALDQEVAKMREKAGADKELQAQITQYRKDQYKQLGDFGQMYSSDEQSRLKNMKDVWMSAEKDIQEINDDRYKNQQEALDKMTSAVKSSKQSEVQAYIDAVDEELRELERLSDGSMDYEEKLSAYKEIKRRELNERLLREERKNLTEMQKLWKDFAEDTKRDFTDIFGAGLKGEFDTIGEAWNSLMDTMKDRFLDLVATLTVNSLFDALNLGKITGGGATWGDLLAMITGASGASSSSGSSGGGNIVTGAASSLAQSYIMKEYVTPIISEITGSISSYMTGASTYFGAAQGGAYTGSVTGATSVGASEAAAAGTGTYAGGAGAVTTTAGTGTAAGAGAGSGASGGGAVAAMGGASAATVAAGLLAVMAIWGTSNMWNKQRPVYEQMNFDSLSMGDISLASGVKQTGELSVVAADNLGKLNNALGHMDIMSLDAASGVMVAADSMVNPETGLTEAVGWMMQVFNEATGQWELGTNIFEKMVEQMGEMGPVTEEAIAATAAYVAEMNGFPTVADELATAFEMMQTGVYDLAGAATGAAGSIISAADSLSSYGSAQFTARDGDTTGGVAIPADYSISDVYYDEPRGHADGGIHYGGWRIVGERGPELEYTPPSRIFSNTDTNSILRGLQDKGNNQHETVVVQIHGKGLEAIIDKVIVTRERQGVTGRAFI